MKLTAHTDYALRMLMTLAVLDGEGLMTIEELARRHRVSRNHLMKVAQTLVGLGLVKSVRGRSGGLRLARDPERIRMGEVVRDLESGTCLVGCLGEGPYECALSGICRLSGALARAMEAFLAELDKVTLADLVRHRPVLRTQLGLDPPAPVPAEGAA